MANQYLVQIHQYITEQIGESQKHQAAASVDQDAWETRFYDGKLAELRKIRAFLSEHFDLHTQHYY